MKTLTTIVANYTAGYAPILRLGQYFVNVYIKQPWPELFYESDNNKAASMIEQWLTNLHYTDTMPPKLRELKKTINFTKNTKV